LDRLIEHRDIVFLERGIPEEKTRKFQIFLGKLSQKH
jgi:hypothetical protein